MRLRTSILRVVVAMVGGCGLAQAACSARTPEQALAPGSVAITKHSASSSSSYYRLAQIVIDPELHRRWALIANCTHPERPLLTIALAVGQQVPTPSARAIGSMPISNVPPLDVQRPAERRRTIAAPAGVPNPIGAVLANTSSPAPSSMAPAIHAGDLVRLWSSDSNVRLEMAVVSLEYGRIGQIVHVRRLGQTALLAGVVVGKDSAELIP